jgi:hypothetical protein
MAVKPRDRFCRISLYVIGNVKNHVAHFDCAYNSIDKIMRFDLPLFADVHAIT